MFISQLNSFFQHNYDTRPNIYITYYINEENPYKNHFFLKLKKTKK